MSTTTEDTPVTETDPVGEADTTPLASDELRQVDQIWLEMLRRQRQSTTQVTWIGSRGILPSTMERWGAGYMPPSILNPVGLDRTGLAVGDLLRAGLVAPRKLKPHEARRCSDPNSKHQLDVDDKDRRRDLMGVRPVLGDRIMIPVINTNAVIKTWLGRLVHDQPLSVTAGDYDAEEADPAPTHDGKDPKYRTLNKNRSSRMVGGAEETEVYPLLLSPGLVERCSGLVLADVFDPSAPKVSKYDKLADKVTPIWVCEGHLDGMLASQAEVSSMSTGGCDTHRSQVDEMVRILSKFAAHHVPIFLCFDVDPRSTAKDKTLEIGAGQRGMCALLARVWARDPWLARHVRVVILPKPAEGEKVDLADILRDVYRSIPVPNCDGETPAEDMLAMAKWADAVVAAQRVKLDELAKDSSVESIEFLLSQLPEAVKGRDRRAALAECGLAAVAAHDPELWGDDEVGPRVAERLGVPSRDAKAWVKSIAKSSSEEAERSAAKDDTDPLAQYRNKDGSIRPTWMSALELLRQIYGRALRWDEMSLMPVLETETGKGNGKVLREKFDRKHFARVRARLAKEYGCDVKKMDLEEAVGDLAIENPVHPGRVWFRSLAKWDAKDRIPELLKALGITPDRYTREKIKLYSAYLLKTLVALIARCMQPGCQVDTMLILQGQQGIRKSSFFRVLLPELEWYGSAGRLDPADKDSLMAIRKKLLLEVAEVDKKSFYNSESEWKDLISCPVDSLRPPYMREVEDYLRSSIFVGTTNTKQFLTDASGARRFWVIELLLEKLKGETIDTDAIESIRIQLWAQALAVYDAWVSRGSKKAECPWWLDPEEDQAHAVDIAHHQLDDLDMDKLRGWLDGQTSRSVTGVEICDKIGWDRGKYGKRVSQWMAALGWTKGGKPTKTGAIYHAPETWRPGAGGLAVHTGGTASPEVMGVVDAILSD